MKLKNEIFLKKVPLKIFHQNVCGNFTRIRAYSTKYME